MAYVQYLRLRNCLTWYTAAIGAMVLLILAIANSSSQLRHGGEDVHNTLGLSALIGIAVYCAAVLATIVGATLNRMSENADFIWVKPISRVRLGALFLGCDVAAIAIGLVIATALFAIVVLDVGWIAHVGRPFLVFDAATLPTLVIGLGIAFMWFGLLQAATAWYRGRGGMVIGLSWAVFVVLLGLGAALPPSPYRDVVMALNHLNPLAYMGSTTFTDTGNVMSFHRSSIFNYDSWTIGAIAWGVGLVGCALALFGWKRLEI